MGSGEIKVNVNAEMKADLQPVIEHTPDALNKLFELLFGVKHAKQKRLMALIEMQQSKDLEKLEEGLAIFNVDQKKLEEISFESNNDKLQIISQTIINEEASNISDCVKEDVGSFISNDTVRNKEFSKDFLIGGGKKQS